MWINAPGYEQILNGMEKRVKFIMTYTWSPDATKRFEGIARYKETGGLPPPSVTLLGRWTRLDLGGGVEILESDDALSVAQFAMQWSDLMEISITPCLDDSQLSSLFEVILTPSARN